MLPLHANCVLTILPNSYSVEILCTFTETSNLTYVLELEMMQKSFNLHNLGCVLTKKLEFPHQ